jgi:hypothetical protein
MQDTFLILNKNNFFYFYILTLEHLRMTPKTMVYSTNMDRL